ncbi:MAG: threonine/homoserine/homoserine lactone efflux protein [Gammaproteobacteria bacterium]|jgi:threonine/homoserine/homoserine lactone efflux protein
MLVVIRLGFGLLFETYPFIHEWINWIEIGYLLFLALKVATANRAKNATNNNKLMNFWQASAFQWINPKAWIMGSSTLATLTSIQSDFLVQVLLVAGAFFTVSTPGAGSWLIFAVGLQRIFRNPHHLKGFNRTTALILVVSIVQVIIDSLTL